MVWTGKLVRADVVVKLPATARCAMRWAVLVGR